MTENELQELGEAPESATTRDRIRDAAIHLFGEKGYDGASMNELAERVGLAKPSLYNYYRAKEDLLLDLVEEAGRQWKAHCMEPFDQPASFERQLADHLRRIAEFSRQRPHMVAVFHLATMHVQGELESRVAEVVARLEAEIRARFHQRIAQAAADGEIDVPSVVDAQIFLGIFFHGLLFLQGNCRHDVGPLEERLAEVWKLLFRGLAGRLPQESLS